MKGTLQRRSSLERSQPLSLIFSFFSKALETRSMNPLSLSPSYSILNSQRPTTITPNHQLHPHHEPVLLLSARSPLVRSHPHHKPLYTSSPRTKHLVYPNALEALSPRLSSISIARLVPVSSHPPPNHPSLPLPSPHPPLPIDTIFETLSSYPNTHSQIVDSDSSLSQKKPENASPSGVRWKIGRIDTCGKSSFEKRVR